MPDLSGQDAGPVVDQGVIRGCDLPHTHYGSTWEGAVLERSLGGASQSGARSQGPAVRGGLSILYQCGAVLKFFAYKAFIENRPSRRYA